MLFAEKILFNDVAIKVNMILSLKY